MANNATLDGQLNVNDSLFNSGAIGATGQQTRFDEYLLTVDQPTANLTLNLTPTGANNVAIVAINPEDGSQIGGSFASGGTASSSFALTPGQEQYRILVTTDSAAPTFPVDYKLRTQVDNGNLTLSSLTTAIQDAPQTNTTLSINGQLTEGDLIVASAGDASLADEYRVVPTVPGETLNAVISQGTGFTPRLQIIDVTNGSITDNVVGLGASATEPLAVGNEYRVRVWSDDALGEANTRNYTLVLSAPSGITASPLLASQGAGIATANTPTLVPNTTTTAPNSTLYASFNKGAKGSVQSPSETAPTNDFNLIGLSGGDDAIDFNNPPALGNPQVFTALQPAIKGDGSTDFDNARWVVALGGNDTFTGTANNDAPIVGNAGNDTFNMGGGADVAVGGADSDVLNGDAGNDILNGNRGNDQVNGGDGDDTLNGGAEDDVLTGGGGKDLLSGDLGRDFLTGGTGDDTFVLNVSGAAATAAEVDVMTDFSIAEADKIQLVGASFGEVTLEALDLSIDGAGVVASTGIKLGAQYLGVVQGVTPYDLASSSANSFV